MHAHVCAMSTLSTSTSKQPHMRDMHIRKAEHQNYVHSPKKDFVLFILSLLSAHLRTYLRSRDYSQIHNGYLLICVVLYPRSFVRCACVICHIVGDLYTRVLRGRNRKQPFHSSKTNMKTKQNQRKQTSRWCSIRTNDCALLFGFSVQWLVEWRTSINALHNFQLERFFGSSHSCSLQSKSTYWPHCIRSGFYSVSWIGQCLCWSLNKCAQSTFSRTSSDRAPFYSQTHQTSASTENHYSFSKSCEVISSGTLRSKIDSFQIDYFRTENSNYFRSFSAFNSFLEFSSRHDRRNTIDYTLLIIKKNR